MSYKTHFESQYNNLIADFAAKIEKTPIELINAAELNDWIRTRTHRWSSIVETEGLMLEQENNSELSHNIRNAFDKLRVEKVTVGKAPSPFLHIGIGVLIAAVYAIAAKSLLHFGIVKTIVGTAAIIAVSVCEYTASSIKKKRDIERELRTGYIKQIENYKPMLLAICDKYKK